jgi:protein-tyrosine phosphatase
LFLYTNPLIDLHCHLLPGIDDGPDTLVQALELAQLAVANGITHAVVTPHIHPGRYENDAASILQNVIGFRAAVEAEGIPLQLGFAGEVRLGVEVLEMVQNQDIPFYGEVDGEKIFLLELPHSHVPPGSDKLIQWLLDRKIRPIIAHPERNKDIMRKRDKIQPFVEMGCLFQLTAGSITGSFGEQALEAARDLLEMGCITIIASDAHNVEYRPPRLDHGRDAAAQIVGAQLAAEMVNQRPAALVAGQFTDLA